MALDKVRIRFRKEGDLRLVSHHDLMRSFERMLRRAAIPFRSTGGFHPTPRLVFASSLPLGVVGLAEVVEIELTEEVEPADILGRLRAQAPLGITFLSAKRIEVRQSARAWRALYRFPLNRSAKSTPEPGSTNLPDEECASVLAAPALWVEREKPRHRRINIRPFIRNLTRFPDALELDLWITPEGTARADEVVRALGRGQLLEQGAVLERTVLEIVDELDPRDLTQGPPRGIPAGSEEPLEGPTAANPTNHHAPSASWGASPNGPVVE